MEDGWYRVVPKEGTSYQLLEVEDDVVVGSDDDTVEDYLDDEHTFTRVYPIHLPDEMMEEVHNQALVANLSDDDVIETAVRNFLVYLRRNWNTEKEVKNEN